VICVSGEGFQKRSLNKNQKQESQNSFIIDHSFSDKIALKRGDFMGLFGYFLETYM